MRAMTAGRSLYDSVDSFGWISIALHWLTAAVIIAMWFIGETISDQSTREAVNARRSLHVTLGLTTWLLLSGRVIWRIVTPHPHVPGQSNQIHTIAKYAHYTMLGLVTVMITTGPLMAWTGPRRMPIADTLHSIHALCADALFVLAVLHICGALKHMMFHEDETILRMLSPRRSSDDSA